MQQNLHVYNFNAMLSEGIKPNKHTNKLYESPNTLYLFHNMISESRGNSRKSDNFTIPIALKACARLRHSHMRNNTWVCEET
ncbi:hypothetical protein DVH24_015672 [Malus domestica]|uniref:Uncharacterized protein n=1 Tax=Malus domestica TaxID=3750 RepID=A0A498HK09_MALDO|nr:hypothetical protein DVH24_015672 [Malus domestica]